MSVTTTYTFVTRYDSQPVQSNDVYPYFSKNNYTNSKYYPLFFWIVQNI